MNSLTTKPSCSRTLVLSTIFLAAASAAMPDLEFAIPEGDLQQVPSPLSSSSNKMNVKRDFDYTGNFPENDLERGELTEVVVPAQIVAKRALMVKRSRVRLCGDQLVNAIKLACMSSHMRMKRSVPDAYSPFFAVAVAPILQAQNEAENKMAEAEDEGLGGRRYARSPVANRFRSVRVIQGMSKRGAADACCKKPCTIAHLETYC